MFVDSAAKVSSSPGHNSGLIAFATILAFHRISVDPDQLRHAIGHDRPIEADDILRLAKQQKDVRAKRIAADWERLGKTPLPALANGPHGWFIIGRAGDEELLIQRRGQSVEELDRGKRCSQATAAQGMSWPTPLAG